jgi:hypothetical protein
MKSPIPPVYVLLNDSTRPRRRMILRDDVNGLVHWARDDTGDNLGALAHCFPQTNARLVIFWRYNPTRVCSMPTCLWCVLEPYKLSRRRL